MVVDKMVMAAVEQQLDVEFESGYLLNELGGTAYKRALRETLHHMRDEHGMEFDSVPSLIRWIEDEQLEYTPGGQLIGGGPIA